jgi:hypothetical protein
MSFLPWHSALLDFPARITGKQGCCTVHTNMNRMINFSPGPGLLWHQSGSSSLLLLSTFLQLDSEDALEDPRRWQSHQSEKRWIPFGLMWARNKLFFGSTGAWAQRLHPELLCQPFFVLCFFKIGFCELFAQAGFELWSSWVDRITGMSHWCQARNKLL